MVFVEEGQLAYQLPCRCNEHAPCPEDVANVFLAKHDSIPSDDFSYPVEASTVPHTDVIKAGSWACEAALWAEEVDLASPFVALSKSEVLLLHPKEFTNVILQYPWSTRQVGRYAENFTDSIGHATSCRWRTVICNECSHIQDITHRVFEHRDHRDGSHYSEKETIQRKTSMFRKTFQSLFRGDNRGDSIRNNFSVVQTM